MHKKSSLIAVEVIGTIPQLVPPPVQNWTWETLPYEVVPRTDAMRNKQKLVATCKAVLEKEILGVWERSENVFFTDEQLHRLGKK